MTSVTNANQISQTSLYDPSGHQVVAWQAASVATDNAVSPPVQYGTPAVDVTVESSEPTASSATLTQVNGSLSSTTLLASNANRKGAYFYNNSSANLYVAYGSTSATTAFTVKVPPANLWEMPTSPVYLGQITGIWDSATGNVQITEL